VSEVAVAVSSAVKYTVASAATMVVGRLATVSVIFSPPSVYETARIRRGYLN